MLSVELVPSSSETLRRNAAYVASFPSVQHINIPDLARFPLRSWGACALCMNERVGIIPHIPATRLDVTHLVPLVRTIHVCTDTALVVSGDVPNGMNQRTFATTIFDVLDAFRSEAPAMHVYAALDPYRHSMRDELAYAETKLRKGFTGFFTQPMFDIALARAYQHHLSPAPIFWGLAPVISDGAVSYWCDRNNICFPRSFSATIEWNVAFGRDFLAYVREENQHCYVMPIRVPLAEYLPLLLA